MGAMKTLPFYFITVTFLISFSFSPLCAGERLCAPAEEGLPFELVQNTRIDQHKRDIQWAVIDRHGKRENISMCYSDLPYCYDFTKNFTPSRKTINSSSYRNTLNIAKVGPHHRSMSIVIENLDRETGMTSFAFSCMMQVYSKSVDVRCEAKEQKDHQVMVNCMTDVPDSQPTPTCEIHQFNENTGKGDIIAEGSQILYRTEYVFKNGERFLRSNCSTTTNIPIPGMYSFSAFKNLEPESSNQATDSQFMTNRSDPILISRYAHLFVPDQFNEDCDERIPVICRVVRFDTQPEFSWSFNGVKIDLKGCQPPRANQDKNTFEQECFISPTFLLNDEKSLECTAKSITGDSERDSLSLPKLQSRHRPQLFINGLGKESKTYNHQASVGINRNSSAWCGHVLPNNKVSKSRVTCEQDRVVLIDKTDSKHNVKFNLVDAGEGKVKCTCTLRLSSYCVDLKSTFDIAVPAAVLEKSNDSSDHVSRRDEPTGTLNLAETVILAMLLILVGLAFGLAVLLCIAHYRKREIRQYSSINSA